MSEQKENFRGGGKKLGKRRLERGARNWSAGQTKIHGAARRRFGRKNPQWGGWSGKKGKLEKK